VPSAPLAIGIALEPRLERRGEYLADARAFEAAGADSLWLGGSEDPWLLAAAAAAVTARVRLVVSATADDVHAPAGLARRAGTLLRLAPGRLAIACAAEVAAAIRAVAKCPVFHAAAEAAAAPAAGADGVVVAAANGLGSEQGPVAQCQVNRSPAFAAHAIWVRAEAPADRAGWRALLARCRLAGAAGLVVREDPRLLDMLRNPDCDDDRSDLALAQG
jgi:hypothetical protein